LITSDAFHGVLKFGEKGQDLGNHELDAGFLGSFHHSVGRFQVDGNRFFDKGVFPGPNRIQCDLFMHLSGQADIYQVDIGVSQQFMVVAVLFYFRKVDLGSPGTKISFNAAPVSSQFLGIAG